MSAGTHAMTSAADRLLLDSTADDWALISPSVYETGRMVAIAPWLAGHAARLRFLCDQQAADGGWGVAGFRLVPTLSATEGLLAACQRRAAKDRAVPAERLAAVAAAGLLALRGWLCDGAAGNTALPDLVAVELVLPRLLQLINERLAEHDQATTPFLPPVARVGPLPTPAGTDPTLLARLRQATAAGRPIPPKLWHSWEIVTSGRTCDPLVAPVEGSVGCSPAATAAWLAGPPQADHQPGQRSLRYLDAVQARGRGPLPIGAPMPYFERAWILNILAAHGVPHGVPAKALDSLDESLGEYGSPAGKGLPVDADDTACVLLALETNHRGRDLAPLMHYFDGERFFTYPEERTASPSANAHALEAVAHRALRHPEERDRHTPVIGKTVEWLLGAQNWDGSWDDKWHGSRYYATACCAQALARYGGRRGRHAVDSAVGWMLDTRQGRRWGHGTGTVEETAYAAMTLLLRRPTERAAEIDEAIAGAERTLSQGEVGEHSTPLWIAKEVYTPVRIVRATQLAALHAIRSARHGR